MDHQPVSDTWERGDPYERYIGRWSRQVAPQFLAWLGCPAGLHWLDVGCGTGALSAAIYKNTAPRRVTGMEPSGGFLRTARANLAAAATGSWLQGNAMAIALAPASVDVVVSALVLNFVPDPRAALAEMVRVTRPGGVIGAYVWDYAGQMEIIRLFWDCATRLDNGAAGLDEARRFPICHPDVLRQLFAAAAGLAETSVTAIDIQARFANFDDYWQPFLGGQGPAPAYVSSMDDRARARLRDCLQQRIMPQEDGSFSLVARAWAVAGRTASRPAR